MNMDLFPFFYNADILFKEHHCLKVLSSFPHAFLDSLSKIRFPDVVGIVSGSCI